MGTTKPYVILAAIELDATSHCALHEAAQVAAMHDNSELHAVHVMLDVPVNELAPMLPSIDERLWSLPGEIQRRVAQVWRAGYAQPVIAHLRSGSPMRGILQTAADLDADLLVVGTHQRNLVERMLLGSVADQVLRNARCPVLVAMPKHYVERDTPQVEPACERCLETRRASAGRHYWCEQHSHAYRGTHVYEPSSGATAVSVMPTH